MILQHVDVFAQSHLWLAQQRQQQVFEFGCEAIFALCHYDRQDDFPICNIVEHLHMRMRTRMSEEKKRKRKRKKEKKERKKE
jgi:hypothetical protein